MRRTLVVALLLVFFISLAYGQQQNKKGLAILEFKEEGDVPKAAGATITNLITNRIDPKQFFIVERSQLSKIFQEKIFGADDVITEEQTKKLKVLNVSYLMLGNVSKIENFYYGGYRIVDVNTAQIGIRDSIVAATDFKEFVEMVYKSLMKGEEPFIKCDIYTVLEKSWFELYKQDIDNKLADYQNLADQLKFLKTQIKRQYNLAVIAEPRWSLSRSTQFCKSNCIGIPYRTVDGSWRFFYIITGTLSTIEQNIDLQILGICFKNAYGTGGTHTQPGWAEGSRYNVGTPLKRVQRHNGGTGNISLSFDNPVDQFCLGGDVELAEKPDKAYFPSIDELD